MTKTYVTYELTLSDTPTAMDPNGALQSGFYVESARKLQQRTVMTESLNVRSGPGVGYPKIHALKAGDVVTVYELVGEWARISQSLHDWVFARYLSL
jgi:uncharacterized protein YraI